MGCIHASCTYPELNQLEYSKILCSTAQLLNNNFVKSIKDVRQRVWFFTNNKKIV